MRGVHVAHRRVGVDALPGVLAEPAVGLQVIEVTTDRTGLRGVHAAIATKLV